MEGRDANVRFPADGRYRLAALRPAQDRYDLLRRVSFSFSFWHLGPFMGAQSLISNGSVRVSQVKSMTYWQNTFLKKRDDYVETTGIDLISGILVGCTTHKNLYYHYQE